MAKVIFLCPFSHHEITGGIKTAYRHAELLMELGFEAFVHQPDGRPSWFDTRAKLFSASPLAAAAGDILVFPEALNGVLAELAQARLAAQKAMLCQNQYFMALNGLKAADYARCGFSRFACPSTIAKHFIEGVIGIAETAVIPCVIDGGLFHPREKRLQIAFAPRKLPREAGLIRTVFQLKYPELAAIPWIAIENRSEAETADILGRSAIFLSLSFFESFGLLPVEAMASGAIVVGSHGYGGLDYATSENGFWLASDHVEEMADTLSRIIAGIQNNAPALAAVREAGFATAARYTKERAQHALAAFYGPLAA